MGERTSSTISTTLQHPSGFPPPCPCGLSAQASLLALCPTSLSALLKGEAAVGGGVEVVFAL